MGTVASAAVLRISTLDLLGKIPNLEIQKNLNSGGGGGRGYRTYRGTDIHF